MFNDNFTIDKPPAQGWGSTTCFVCTPRCILYKYGFCVPFSNFIIRFYRCKFGP